MGFGTGMAGPDPDRRWRLRQTTADRDPGPAALTFGKYTRREMTQDPNSPPVARKEHKETVLHGTTLIDDYAWLRDKENPDVTAYLEAENAYAEAVVAPLADLREDLYKEMLSHVKQTDISVPYRDGVYWYYARTEEGQQYAIHCRRRGTFSGPKEDAEEEV